MPSASSAPDTSATPAAPTDGTTGGVARVAEVTPDVQPSGWGDDTRVAALITTCRSVAFETRTSRFGGNPTMVTTPPVARYPSSPLSVSTRTQRPQSA